MSPQEVYNPTRPDTYLGSIRAVNREEEVFVGCLWWLMGLGIRVIRARVECWKWLRIIERGNGRDIESRAATIGGGLLIGLGVKVGRLDLHPGQLRSSAGSGVRSALPVRLVLLDGVAT